ncbi:AAA family ATPase [Streptomyces sp. NPDC093544]|uniref:AAA family ATPase n=1 Tax=Streptomyces sp. NPDC093544 TaxID=3155200 RepID=UPI0034453C57
MSWNTYYVGNGEPRDVTLADPPPWRTFPRVSDQHAFQPPEGLTDAVNAALYLHRPLLITGSAGTGKSTVIEQVAAELKLGPVLRWHITSRSTLPDALYQYDALGHIHSLRLHQTAYEGRLMGRSGGRGRGRDRTKGNQPADDIAPFLKLGPLGTALLPGERPRALLIDEIDKSDLDLPSDLLDVLERGEFEIPELVRHRLRQVQIREWGEKNERKRTCLVRDGHVQCTRFPFIVMTSNGERDFPAPFLRRCIRYSMPAPTVDTLRDAVAAHLQCEVPETGQVPKLIEDFAARVARGDALAVDQLLNAVRLISDEQAPSGARRDRILDLLLRELSGG